MYSKCTRALTFGNLCGSTCLSLTDETQSESDVLLAQDFLGVSSFSPLLCVPAPDSLTNMPPLLSLPASLSPSLTRLSPSSPSLSPAAAFWPPAFETLSHPPPHPRPPLFPIQLSRGLAVYCTFLVFCTKKKIVGLSLMHLFGCLQAENFISADEFIGSWMVA